MLQGNPPWRSTFFSLLPSSITDARTPLYLLLALQETKNPPTAKELSQYIDFLIQKQFPEVAYYTWLQFLPPDQLTKVSPLYNASFEIEPSGLPFDWVLTRGRGVTTEIVHRADRQGEHALLIEFSQGRVEFPGVTQLTLLAPGTYELKGKYKGLTVGRRGLAWRVTCVGKDLLAQSENLSGDVSQWRELSLTFTVPEKGCRAQQVRLDLDARSASEQLVSGSMWFDDMEIRKGG